MTHSVELVVAPPLTPGKLAFALAELHEHGAPSEADLEVRMLHDGLQLRVRW